MLGIRFSHSFSKELSSWSVLSSEVLLAASGDGDTVPAPMSNFHGVGRQTLSFNHTNQWIISKFETIIWSKDTIL